jgi:hypothetical protein
VRGAVWLDHPSRKRAREPTLILYPTGLVVSDCAKDPSKEQLRLDPNQAVEFSRFLNTIPKPSLWERSSEFRASAIVLLVFSGVIGLIWVVGSALLAMVGTNET